jgi:hypothetical protein
MALVMIFHSQVQQAQQHHDRGIDFCYIHQDCDASMDELRKAVALRESLLGKFHNDTALTNFRIVNVLREDKKEYDDALVAARREFRSFVVGPGTP